jgi:hypothetical protein
VERRSSPLVSRLSSRIKCATTIIGMAYKGLNPNSTSGFAGFPLQPVFSHCAQPRASCTPALLNAFRGSLAGWWVRIRVPLHRGLSAPLSCRWWLGGVLVSTSSDQRSRVRFAAWVRLGGRASLLKGSRSQWSITRLAISQPPAHLTSSMRLPRWLTPWRPIPTGCTRRRAANDLVRLSSPNCKQRSPRVRYLRATRLR